jgi:hypothetical protein
MRGARCRRYTGQRGAALIEFVLVLPLVLLILFGIIDFGKAFNYWNDETHLANEAARYAVVNKNPFGTSSLEAGVKDDAESGELKHGCSGCSIRSPGVKVSFCFVRKLADGVTPDTSVGAPLRATVVANYHWLAYLVGQGLPLTSGMSASSTMRVEQPYNTADPSQNKYLRTGPVACS